MLYSYPVAFVNQYSKKYYPPHRMSHDKAFFTGAVELYNSPEVTVGTEKGCGKMKVCAGVALWDACFIGQPGVKEEK